VTEGTLAPAWEPGEPLYPHPAARPSGDGNYIRELFQEMCDEEVAVRAFLKGSYGLGNWTVRCEACLVSWAPDEGPRCWVCGKHAAHFDEALDEAERLRTQTDSAVLRGGPRDRDMLVVQPGTPEILVPEQESLSRFYVSAEEVPSLAAELRTTRYVRSNFNYSSRYWVYTHKENA
jgi:hypothetical protein